MIGLSGPSAIMDILTRSDMLNCQHSIIELVTSSYSQKSAFWSMYGRSHMSSMVSQLLLNLDNSGSRAIGSKRGSDAVYATGEATAISIANLIRQLHDLGQEKLVDKLFNLAKSLFGNESSICGEIWRYTSLQVEFERSLHQTNWSKAASTIVEAEAFSTTGSYAHSRSYSDTNIPFEALFMKLQLNIYRGDAEAAATVRKMMHQHVTSDNENDKINPHQQVRLLILDAELSCLTNCYPNAIPHLIEAASICDKNFMQFHKAMIFLHTAHIQLQFGLASRALDLVNRCLPIIFAHGSLFECGRAKLLLAKCLVASAERGKCLINCKSSAVRVFRSPVNRG
jgi:anaphase-promoting complex subunit 5